MNREEIQQLIAEAPPVGDPERTNYFMRVFGSITGWITEPDRKWLCDALPDIGRSFDHPPRIVEIGTFAGATARGFIALTGGGVITCVDDWYEFKHYEGRRETNYKLLGPHASGPDFFWWTLHQTPDLSQYANVVEADSKVLAKTWDKPIDILFVDGDHSYEGAKSDIEGFGAHVVMGGYLLVDDVHMPPVRKALDEYFARGGWRWVRNDNLAALQRV